MAATINKQEIIAKYGKNSGTDRAFTDTSQRSSFQTWSAENGWSEKRSAELPEGNRYRKIPCNHCRTGSEKVIYR